jgi:hypothetical protein
MKPVVPLLQIAVLVRTPGLDPPPFEVVMPEQRLILLLKIRLLSQVVDRRRHPVGPVQQRHTTQLPERVLENLRSGSQSSQTGRPYPSPSSSTSARGGTTCVRTVLNANVVGAPLTSFVSIMSADSKPLRFIGREP